MGVAGGALQWLAQACLRGLLCLAWLCLAAEAGAVPFTVVTSNYPPYSFEENGAQKGIGVDVVKEAFARMQTDVRIEFFPFPRAIAMLQHGEADAIFPFSIRDDRIAYTLFPMEKLVEDTQTLFVRSDSAITFDGDLKKMGGFSFGRQRGAENGSLFAEAVRSGSITQIDEAVDQRQNILKLVGGRFQIAIGPRLVVLFYARETGSLGQIRELQPAVDKPLAAYLGFSKLKSGSAAMVERFNATLRQMRQDGSYDRIVSRYVR